MFWEQVYQQWLDGENIPENLENKLKDLNTGPEKCRDAFYVPLEFGTVGMRGILGAGINRMNTFTVRQTTEGLARFMDMQDPEAKRRGVIITYDLRHMPPEFAMEAAKTLAKHDIPSFVFEGLRPTPELSFTVRYFKAFAGIMITASHSPAAYNGYEVYSEDGGQTPPTGADVLAKYVRSIENLLKVSVLSDEEVTHSGLISIVGEEVDNVYLKKVETVTINRELTSEMGKELKLVYTPLHGARKALGEEALKQAGSEKFVLVPEQVVADPDFITVKLPNPEEHSASEYAVRLGEKEGADLLIATDPDVDRLGAAVWMPNGDYRVLTENQLGSIMIHYILEAHRQASTLPQNASVLKSIISSELVTVITEKYNTKIFNVLTGFRFIAEKIQQYEEDHSQTFTFGFEESCGYLVRPFVRNKDAIQAPVLLAEAVASYRKQGKALYDGLQDIFEEFGYSGEKTISVTMNGIEGGGKIKALIAKYHGQAPTEFAEVQVVQTGDFRELTRTSADGQAERLQTPPSDVLRCRLEDGSRIAIRPSGAEPKVKFYLATRATSSSEASKKIAVLEAVVNELTK